MRAIFRLHLTLFSLIPIFYLHISSAIRERTTQTFSLMHFVTIFNAHCAGSENKKRIREKVKCIRNLCVYSLLWHITVNVANGFNNGGMKRRRKVASDILQQLSMLCSQF